jgi:EAL domain-containing protein (putative c-di-GMP-specific phosphodiesterase class I)
VRLADGVVTGVEALVRWQHPERGLLPPAAFLPAAEQSGLIEPLTAWVLHRALADQQEWTAAGRDWTVSVNVSARNLESPSFASFVIGLPSAPGRLILEITETAAVDDEETAQEALRALAEAGIGISVDDFGTGYTSLGRLRGVPLTEIKIDRSFVDTVPSSTENQAIVRSVIALAHGLGCRATAEGVETAEVASWVAAAGCDEAQGYLYSRPVPWKQVPTMEAVR